jgi:hypothetical protein
VYLTKDFESVTLPLLSVPSGPEPLQYIVRHSHQTAIKEELEKFFISEVDPEVLFSEAEGGYAALSTLLGEDMYFFNARFYCIVEFF